MTFNARCGVEHVPFSQRLRKALGNPLGGPCPFDMPWGGGCEQQRCLRALDANQLIGPDVRHEPFAVLLGVQVERFEICTRSRRNTERRIQWRNRPSLA